MACTTGCATKDHASYADCLRSKRSRVAYCNTAGGQDYTAQKKWDRELEAYRDAKAEGLQPSGTKMHQITAAKAIADATGTAYKAG